MVKKMIFLKRNQRANYVGHHANNVGQPPTKFVLMLVGLNIEDMRVLKWLWSHFMKELQVRNDRFQSLEAITFCD
jgi:hypothetical protein